ncbi:TonB-dependent receptor domain-containing protein [Carboxylicivirga sp. M1479]|uniref:TonB-dependent receptor domain-containing protein n=1 Tax=Carboxylicivirga sp. M1479 TaxID=2594476 RepID=UPI0011782076|nr:TonB-dependent receptor [Carboxylicivirga sp. M1479]TRX70588.1 TonB-dependent receptor [Carboxylicivirga sp. M1479]
MKFLTLLLGMLISVSLMANTPEKEGIVKGKVYDGKSKKPVEYATVAIYNAVDNSVITGTISDENGNFKIKGLKEGSFYVVVSFLGYDNKRYDNITVDGGRDMIDLGSITLGSANQSLEEVEVIAERQSVEFHIDKKVVSVGKQMTSASLSAVEVLENVPSVRVDIEGNVSLRGSTGFTVLVDGKPTVLEPSDVLRQTPASTIENIEIITNPSAKYQPDGTGGIINIITKKNRTQGVQGLINAKGGTFGMYGGDFLLNWRKKKVNFNIGADYNNRPFPGETYTRRETYQGNESTIIEAAGDNERAYYGGGARGGIDWDITERDNLSFSARIGKFNMGSDSELDYLETRTIDNSIAEYNSYNESNRSGTYYSLTTNYAHKFAQKGHELSAQLNYRGHDGDEFSENFRSQNEVISDGTRTTEIGPNKRWELRLDYVKPVGENDMFEAGFQGRAGMGDDETKLYRWDVDQNDFIEDLQNRNTTTMDRNIYALYSVYKGKVSQLGYQLGLRGEYTDRLISSSGVNETYVIDRVDFFPTLHLSYQLPKDNQLMASYSRRIDRPRGYYLEPFVTWVDQYNVRSGNPNLAPEYIDALELGYLKEWDKMQLSLEGYYRITHDKIEGIIMPYEDSPEVFLRTYDNIGTDYSLGAEAMLNIPVAKWWEMNVMGNLYDYRIDSNYEGVEDRSSFNWSSRVNNSFVLRKNIKLQIDGNYDSPTVTAQGETEGNYYMNAAVRMDFLDRKLSAVVQARDVLATSQRVSITEDPNFYSYQKRTRKAPMISFTLSYRLNNFIQKRGRGGADSGGGMEGEF